MKEKSMQMGKRILLYCVGLFIMAMGVSFSGAADLGMSPVNSIPYVLSEIFTFLSMGTWIIIIFSLYIVIQFLILGRDLQPWRVLQLVCTTLFGYFTDFTNMLADRFLPAPETLNLSAAGIYGVRLVYLVISMALIALGILFYLAPDLISLPGEGIMQVISEKCNQPLPVVKMCFDCTVSIIALVISLVYFTPVPRHPGRHRHCRHRRGQDPEPVRPAETDAAPFHVRSKGRMSRSEQILYPPALAGAFSCPRGRGSPYKKQQPHAPEA